MPENTVATALQNIGRNFYEYRRTLRHKLDTVARSTGISESTLSKIENGHYECLTIKLLIILADYYQKELHEVLQPPIDESIVINFA